MPDSVCVRKKQDGAWKCRICNLALDDLVSFKKHVFVMHNDIEAQSKYQRSIQDLVGNKQMERMRAPIVRMATLGTLDDYLIKIIDPQQ
jgi:hypothetical protein